MLSPIGIWILVFAIPLIQATRKWDYEPVSITTSTSDPSKLSFELNIDRLGRGDFAVSGPLDLKYDVNEETTVEATAFLSSSGAELEYKLLPWSIPKTPFYDFLNTYYKDVIISNLEHCTNFPKFKGKFQPPFPQATFKFDKCKIDGEGMPEIAPPGFYKIIFTITGPGQPTWGFTGIFKLTLKTF